MSIDTPQGTGEPMALSDDEAAARIQSILDPQEDTPSEDENPDHEPEEPEADAPEAEDEAEDTEEADDETDDEPGSPQTVKVKVHGEELELPIEEVAKGYQRQADFTRKTQELAEQRKAMEADLAQSKAQYAQIINQLGQALDGQQAKAPDPSLAETDPYEYTRQLAQWQEHKARSEAIKQEQARMQEEHKQMEVQRLHQHVAREGQVLLERIPEWRDQSVMKAEQTKIRNFLQDFGVKPEELSDPYSVFQTDHRAILLARMAMKGAALAEGKPKAESKAKGKPKVAKPGAARSKGEVDGYQRARGRLKKTGSLDDAAAALKHLI